jgi:hypothetical protein
MNPQPQDTEDATIARKRRTTLYVIGSAVGAAGLTMGTMPAFAAVTPIAVAKGCAIVGALILAAGRFAPDHVLRKILPARR